MNADVVLGKKGSILSHNIFSYCKNSPIVFSDASGCMQDEIGGGISSRSLPLRFINFFIDIIKKLDTYNPLDEIGNGTLEYREYTYAKSKGEQMATDVIINTYKIVNGAIAGAVTTAFIKDIKIGAIVGAMLVVNDMMIDPVDYPTLSPGTYRIREVVYTENMGLFGMISHKKTHYIIESTDGSNYVAIGYYRSVSGPGVYDVTFKLLYEQSITK